MYKAGFVINREKSVWEPTQLLDWLGISWNFALGTLKIVETRIVKIINTINHIIEADLKVSARVLVSLTGQIISTGLVVGNIHGRIMTRHCVLSTLSKDNWDSVFSLDDYCKEEVYFWKDNMVNIITRYYFVSKAKILVILYIQMPVLPRVEQLLTFTMFLCVTKCGRRARAFKVQREGSCLLLSFHCNHLPQCLKDHTFSGLSAEIVEVGSMKLGLHKMARRIFDICIRSGIHLEVQGIPRTSNQQTDYISRLIDTDDWQITKKMFFFLMAGGGP